MADAEPDGTIPRPRLVGPLVDEAVVVLAAPAGHGTSTLAGQLARARTGPAVLVRFTDAHAFGGVSARVLEALTEAFPVLGSPRPVADTTGPAQLAYALDEVAGPATLVLEDLHHLTTADAEALLTAVAGHAADGVQVVATTQADLVPGLLRLTASRGGRVVDTADLLFDTDECVALAALHGAELGGEELRERSGGWPLAAAALARVGEQITPALAAEVLTALGEAARTELSAVALVSSVPVEVVRDAGTGDELLRFARRHPAVVDLSEGRFGVRALLQQSGVLVPPGGDLVAAAVDLADRLERAGEREASLLVLSRLEGDRAALQDRLDSTGPGLLSAGRFRLVHEAVSRIPLASRRPGVLVLDAAARLGLQQLESVGEDQRVEDVGLARLATRDDLDADLRLAVAGLRADALRREGDPELVQVALEALAEVGPVDGSVTAADLVRDRSPLARRGLHLVLYSLGAAASFSGDAAMMAEGRRLQELSLGVAERAGIDAVVLRGQVAYERVAIAVERPSAVLGTMEAAVAALGAAGHPEAANHLAQLGDVHVRLGATAAAVAAVEAGRDWAERTGNQLVTDSLDLVEGAARLLADGPSPASDLHLDGAWSRFVASRRLRRTAPSVALRFANAMIDVSDRARADVWLDRARALMGERLQGGYQADYLRSVEERRRVLDHPPDPSTPLVTGRFAAQPAGESEFLATQAWDRLRRGDASKVAEVLAAVGDVLDPPWPERLGPAAPGATTPDGPAGAPAGGPDVVVRVLCPEVQLWRSGRPGTSPTGHAARLLALLALRDGVLPVAAAMEDLWPGTDDAAAARNRFHQVLHRVRRALGVGADGPLTVNDGVVRLDPAEVGSDVALLRALGGADLADADTRARAVTVLDDVRSSLCAAQFAYDEELDEDRWELDRRVVDLAVGLLEAAPGDQAGRSTVWALWDRLPEQFGLGEALAASADEAGLEREASRARRRLEHPA